MEENALAEPEKEKTAALKEHETNVCAEEKMEQFRLILGGIVSRAIEDNNEVLGKEVSSRVSDSVIKEMDYLLRKKSVIRSLMKCSATIRREIERRRRRQRRRNFLNSGRKRNRKL